MVRIDLSAKFVPLCVFCADVTKWQIVEVFPQIAQKLMFSGCIKDCSMSMQMINPI